MKTLGLIGGMRWESTAIYYRHLNELARQRLGGLSFRRRRATYPAGKRGSRRPCTLADQGPSPG